MSDLTTSAPVDALLGAADNLAFARILRCPLILYSFYANSFNTGTDETDLYTGTLPANLFTNLGDTVDFHFRGEIGFDGIDANFKFYIDSSWVEQTDLLEFAGVVDFRLQLCLINSDTLRILTFISGKEQTPQLFNMRNDSQNGLDFSSVIGFKFTGQNNDGSGECGGVYLKVTFLPA